MTVETRSIGRFHADYRLTAAAPDARARLDALLERVLDAALEGALARAGVSPDEEVCVRSVAADARLRLASTDAELVAQWSASLAEALAAAIAAGEPTAVRYHSRREALLDVALATAVGDVRRAWAWRRLGLWPDGDAADGAATVARLADTLSAEPRSVVPVLAAVARRGALPRLAVLFTAAGWQRLARAALAAAGVSDRVLEEESPDRDAAPADTPPLREREETALARRLFSASAIATAAAGSGAAVGLAPASRRALAALVVLEADPASLAAGREIRAAALLTAVGALLDAPRGTPPPSAGERGRRSTDSRSALASAGIEPEPARGRSTDAPGTHSGDDPQAVAPPSGAVPEARVLAWTDAGGLLFLLPFVAELDPLGGRTLRWTLHRLALVLLPTLDEADPAALAFAGLGPDELPPSDDGEPPADEELAALAAIAAAIAPRLAAALEREPEPALLASVCARRAEVVAEPGWIELRLALEQLDIDVRRAGLDLDPGWLPWLGVVVRFVYA
jgi:hypothetical protein